MGKALLLQLFCCFGVSIALKSWQLPHNDLRALATSEMNAEWTRFKKTYNKTYVDVHDELKRRLYWEDTIRFIGMHNLKFERGEVTFSLGENEFADLAEDEFANLYLTETSVTELETNGDFSYLSNNPTCSHIDWRQDGLVTPVKNERRCECSTILAVLASLEGVYKKAKGGKLRSLSAQNVVDCSNSFSRCRCLHSSVYQVYQYIAKNDGIDSEECYPAKKTTKRRCHYTKCCKAATCTGYRSVKKDERSLADAVASVGPVVIGMDVNDRAFWYYTKGIYFSPRCSKTRLNHVMAAVGYGSDVNGKEYWIVKNSWGTQWGDKGYVYVARNRDNMCGIASFANYPTV